MLPDAIRGVCESSCRERFWGRMVGLGEKANMESSRSVKDGAVPLYRGESSCSGVSVADARDLPFVGRKCSRSTSFLRSSWKIGSARLCFGGSAGRCLSTTAGVMSVDCIFLGDSDDTGLEDLLKVLPETCKTSKAQSK